MKPLRAAAWAAAFADEEASGLPWTRDAADAPVPPAVAPAAAGLLELADDVEEGLGYWSIGADHH